MIDKDGFENYIRHHNYNTVDHGATVCRANNAAKYHRDAEADKWKSI